MDISLKDCENIKVFCVGVRYKCCYYFSCLSPFFRVRSILLFEKKSFGYTRHSKKQYVILTGRFV